MLYNRSDPWQLQQLKARCEKICQKESGVVEITEKLPRTLSQNAYLHVICDYLGLCLGETMEYVKNAYFKNLCSPDIFVCEKYDKVLRRNVRALRSSASITKEDMSVAIDRFLQWAAQELDIYIPSPDDHRCIQALEVEVNRARRWTRPQDM